MMSTQTSTVSLYPPGGFGAPKNRHGHATAARSACRRAPWSSPPTTTSRWRTTSSTNASRRTSRTRRRGSGTRTAPTCRRARGSPSCRGDFSAVLMQYDDLAGAASTNIEARIQELREDGVDKELAFPNAVLALFHYPDKKLRETRLPHLQRVHRRAAGAFRRPLLRCRADQLVGSRGHPADAGRAEVVGAQDVPDAAEPG